MTLRVNPKSRRFRHDERGSVAILFGLLAIPMLMFIGLAVDYGRAWAAKRNLREAVDAAAIAASAYKLDKKSSSSFNTADGLITQSEGKSVKQVAIDYLKSNSSLRYMKNLTPDAREGDDSTITVMASAQVPATFAKFVVDKFDIQAEAKTRMSGKPAPFCLLGLNSAAPETVKAWGTADLVAPGCAVLSNSSNSNGLVTGGTATMTGAAFCSAGGASGSGFTPAAKTKCPVQSDPYAGQFTQAALASKGLIVPGGCNYQSTMRVKNATTINANGGVITFCGGVNVSAGGTLTLGPGVYVIFNDLTVNSNATLDARQGTTIILANSNWMTGTKDGRIYVFGGGNFLLTAPKSGPTASMAVLQPSVSNYTGGSTWAIENTIIGGGKIEIVGNWYSPQAKTRITGSGVINANSSYFAIVSDFVDLEGNGELHLNAGGDPSLVGMSGVPGQLSSGGHISLIE